MKTLTKVQPLKNLLNHERIQTILDNLVKVDFLEILDQNELNTVYRFNHPFMRESLYNSMIFLQRRQLHRFVAEAMQTVMLPMAGSFEIERKRLEYHWSLAENQISNKGVIII